MIILTDTSFRRTALVVSAVASLAVRAAGNPDAAFAAALGKAPSGLEATAQLKTQSQIPAAAQVKGPAAPAGAWKKILDTLRRDGVKGGDKDFFTLSLTGAAGDPKKTHGIIVFLGGGARADFAVVGVELTVEGSVLTLSSGVIVTETWIILATSTGAADQVVYKKRVDTPGLEPIEERPVVVNLADPKVKAVFDESISYWSTR